MFVMAGCVLDNADECPSGTRVSLFAQTACQTAPTWPEVSVVRFFAFGQDGTLAATVDDWGAVLSPSYRLPLQLAPGTYTLLVWARLGVGGYDVVEPVIGKTTREDLILRLRYTSGKLEGVNGLRLWAGQADNVVVADHRTTDVAINMHEETNRVTVEVDGFSRPDDLGIEIVTRTSGMKYSISVEQGDALGLDGLRTRVANEVIDLFTMLQLNLPAMTDPEVRADLPALGESSRTLVITDNDDGEQLFHGDLIDEIIAKNPNVNTACTHDFAIRFAFGELPDGTHIIIGIWVNDWLIHSYDSEL